MRKTTGRADPGAEEKPFRLVKSFSAAAVVLVFATVLTLAAAVARQAETIIATRVEDDTLKLMENLNSQMFYNFLVPAKARYGQVLLREPEQQALLRAAIARTIHGFDIKRVIIYNPGGEVVFATDPTPLQSVTEDEAFQEALARYADYYAQNLWFQLKDLWLAGLTFTLAARRGEELDYVQPDPRRFLWPEGGEGDFASPRDETVYIPSNLYEFFLARPESRRRFFEGTEAAPSGTQPSASEEGGFIWRWSLLQNPEPRAGTDEAFMSLLRRLTVYRYEGGQRFFPIFPKGEIVLRGYRFMEDPDTRGLTGVLEIDRDLTLEYRQIARLQYFALGAAALLALLLTVALRWVVSRGEDILNRRSLERQALLGRLNQAERLAGLGSMVATVAHEIRNPLGIIHSTADVLGRLLAREPDQARLAAAIIEEADRLSTVVTEFLDFARPPEPKAAPVVVEEILEEVLASLEITLSRASVETRLDFRDEPGPVQADAHMLHRAFLNIIMNAIQAMDEGGLLTVSTRLEPGGDGGGRLWVIIRDTGPGLSEETAGRVFNPFFTTKAKGTGLGLIIVRNIIEAHGGAMELVNSRADGRSAADEAVTGLTVRLGLKI
ncbi:MAG: ATP-binding protein [Deltaproteobacteria bacterium]|nr:ATP-binding protein [Deltaproteobacteria bacterium]